MQRWQKRAVKRTLRAKERGGERERNRPIYNIYAREGQRGEQAAKPLETVANNKHAKG